MLPETALSVLHQLFPTEAIGDLAPTYGGFSNLTVTATIGGRRVAVKAASHPAKRADVRREAAVLGAIHGLGLAAPEPLALADGDHWTVSVTGWMAGEPGLRLYELPPAELARPYEELGRALAAVHRLDEGRRMKDEGVSAAPAGAVAATAMPSSFVLDRVPPQHLSLAPRAEATRAALPALGLEDALLAALDVALAHPAWRAGPAQLVHGDAGLHNILWGGERLAGLLDWEWAGWGNPALDLAWVRWTMRFRAVPDELWGALLEGYGPAHAALDLSDSTMDALALGQIAGILVRSHGRPGAWEEWVRRARLTASSAPARGS